MNFHWSTPSMSLNITVGVPFAFVTSSIKRYAPDDLITSLMTQAVRPLWIECKVAYVKGYVDACAALSPTNSPGATKLSRYY